MMKGLALTAALLLQAGAANGNMVIDSVTCDHGAKGKKGQQRGDNGLELVVTVHGVPVTGSVTIGVAPEGGTAAVGAEAGCFEATESGLSEWSHAATDKTTNDGAAKFRIPVTDCIGAKYIQAAYATYKNAGGCTLSEVAFMPEATGVAMRIKVAAEAEPTMEEVARFADDVLKDGRPSSVDFDLVEGFSPIESFRLVGAEAPALTDTESHYVNINVPFEYFNNDVADFDAATSQIRYLRNQFIEDGDKKGLARRIGGAVKGENSNAPYHLADSAVWRAFEEDTLLIFTMKVTGTTYTATTFDHVPFCAAAEITLGAKEGSCQVISVMSSTARRRLTAVSNLDVKFTILVASATTMETVTQASSDTAAELGTKMTAAGYVIGAGAFKTIQYGEEVVESADIVSHPGWVCGTAFVCPAGMQAIQENDVLIKKLGDIHLTSPCTGVTTDSNGVCDKHDCCVYQPQKICNANNDVCLVGNYNQVTSAGGVSFDGTGDWQFSGLLQSKNVGLTAGYTHDADVGEMGWVCDDHWADYENAKVLCNELFPGNVADYTYDYLGELKDNREGLLWENRTKGEPSAERGWEPSQAALYQDYLSDGLPAGWDAADYFYNDGDYYYKEGSMGKWGSDDMSCFGTESSILDCPQGESSDGDDYSDCSPDEMVIPICTLQNPPTL